VVEDGCADCYEIINGVEKINREKLFAIYHKTKKKTNNPGASQIIMWQMHKKQQEILRIC